MRPFLKTSFVFVSILLTTLTSCKQTAFLSVGMVELPKVTLPVSETQEKLSFKTILATSHGEFTGITMIKRMPGGGFRIAFFSEVGMSYMQAFLEGDYPYTLTLRTISPFLSSKKTIRHLETAFNLMLVQKQDMISGNVVKDKDAHLWIAGGIAGGGTYYGRIDATGRVDRSFLENGRNVKAQYEYGDEMNAFTAEFNFRKEIFLVLSLL